MGPGYQLPALGLQMSEIDALTFDEAETYLSLLTHEQQEIMNAVSKAASGSKENAFYNDGKGFAPDRPAPRESRPRYRNRAVR